MLQVVLLALFTIFVTIGAYTTTHRLLRYRTMNEDVPLILWRDVIARNGLALPFIAIMVVRAARAFGIDVDDIVNDWPWVLFTSTPAVVGAGIYAYFEIFVIERTSGPHEAYHYPGGNGNGNSHEGETKNQREDRSFGETRRELEVQHSREEKKDS